MSHQRSRARENVVKRRTPKVVTATVGEERRKKGRADSFTCSVRDQLRSSLFVHPFKCAPRDPGSRREKTFQNFKLPKKKFKNFEQNIFDIRRFFGDFRETREASPCVCSVRSCPPLARYLPRWRNLLGFRAHFFFRGFGCGQS